MSQVDVASITAAPAAQATVLVVDDHALLRTGVANIISQEPTLRVVAEAANGLKRWKRISATGQT